MPAPLEMIRQTQVFPNDWLIGLFDFVEDCAQAYTDHVRRSFYLRLPRGGYRYFLAT